MLIAMAVWDTPENRRASCTRQTLESLSARVDFKRHRLFIVDNGSTDEGTAKLLHATEVDAETRALNVAVIRNATNRGTAKAVNQAWQHRLPGEHCVKMDNDVVVNETNWPDLLEEVFARAPSVGICGLKRKDVAESPTNPNPWFKSALFMLPHKAGERWLVVEQVRHVIGTCQAYNSALLDKIGYLYQLEGVYGFDDSLAAARCTVAKFANTFLPHVDIDHVDTAEPAYVDWKQKYAGALMQKYEAQVRGYENGSIPIYHGP